MVELVSSRTELRRAGANRMTGLCPFHEERTPSFGINPAEKVYYCFGCQAQGDAFTFVMETEGVDFKGALELLADRYRVPLELAEEDPHAAEKRQRSERLLELLERTAAFYVRQLWESREAERARAYLADRGLEEATLREFRVGYAPSAWETVLNASRRAKYSNRELFDSGLAQKSQKSGKIYDRFRSQIIFPLADSRGRVRGFAGPHAGRRRRHAPEVRQQPRGRAVSQGPAAVRRGSRAVVLGEGELRRRGRGLHGRDRDAPGRDPQLRRDHGHGADRRPARRAAAPCARGAARARRRQRRARRRCCAPPRVAQGRKLALRVVALPPGEDPADLVKRTGGDEIRRRVEESAPFVRFRVLQALETSDLTDAEGRDRVSQELTSVFSLLGPSAEREELRRIAADRLDLSPELLERVLHARRRDRGAGRGSARSRRSGPRCLRGRRGGDRATAGGGRSGARAPRADGTLVSRALHRAAAARCARARRARSRRRPHERLHAPCGGAPARASRRADDRARRGRSAAGVHARDRGRRRARGRPDAGEVRDRAPAADARAPGARDRRSSRIAATATSPRSPGAGRRPRTSSTGPSRRAMNEGACG